MNQQTKLSSISRYDCIIVGGGMVGAALALGLAQIGYRTVVIEKDVPQAFDSAQPPDIRLSAFNMHSVKLLSDLGAWQHVEQMRYRQYDALKCWDGENTAFSSPEHASCFRATEVGENKLGFFVENRLIQLGLYDEITSAYNDYVDFVFDKTIKYIEPAQAKVELDDGNILQANIVFGADGANSLVRQAAGIGTLAWQYSQQASAILIETTKTVPSETWQAFYHSGPRALLPMYNNYACLVWYDNAKQTQWIKSADNKQVHAAVKEKFPDLFGDFTIVNKASFGLTRMHASKYAHQRAVLVGDAAHTINPLAGQGVNLGFKDVAALLESITSHGIENISAVAKDYEKARRLPNLLMMSTMDALYKGFSTPSLPIQVLRGIGLKLADRAGPLKQKALKYAMGL